LSCLGGLDANCADGYTGPLCAVCDKRHYKLVATCFRCPALHWLIFQVDSFLSKDINFFLVAILLSECLFLHRFVAFPWLSW
jgi:hypothetical protein